MGSSWWDPRGEVLAVGSSCWDLRGEVLVARSSRWVLPGGVFAVGPSRLGLRGWVVLGGLVGFDVACSSEPTTVETVFSQVAQDDNFLVGVFPVGPEARAGRSRRKSVRSVRCRDVRSENHSDNQSDNQLVGVSVVNKADTGRGGAETGVSLFDFPYEAPRHQRSSPRCSTSNSSSGKG